MLDGPSVVAALENAGVTHVVWIPDSELGTWESALSSSTKLKLIRVCREGEAFAVAAGLDIAGLRPIVAIQCTGLYEAGDALRNILHDLKRPLFLIVGVRSHNLYKQGKTGDSCPVFIEPFLQAWKIPFTWLPEHATAKDLQSVYTNALNEKRAGALLIAE